MEFKDFYELATKVTEYEELHREESQRRKTTKKDLHGNLLPGG